jgi:hypothetical protein
MKWSYQRKQGLRTITGYNGTIMGLNYLARCGGSCELEVPGSGTREGSTGLPKKKMVENQLNNE